MGENPMTAAARASGKPRVWIVDSAYTGELNARIGVAERLGLGYALIPRPEGDGPGYIESLRRMDAAEAAPESPLVVLSGTGEDTTDAIADLKPAFGARLLNVFLASILPEDPPPRLHEYDLIASPQIRGPKVVPTLGIPHRVDRAALARAGAGHAGFFAPLRRPLIALLIGGNTRYCFGFDVAHARGLACRVRAIAAPLGASVVATNSRRTPEDAWAALREELAGLGARCVDWREKDRRFYFALLDRADVFVATGDSLSMCSEVSATGKPLLIDLTEETTEQFHRDILAGLFEHGAARPLTDRFEPWRYVPPDPTGTVAAAIRERLGLGPVWK